MSKLKKIIITFFFCFMLLEGLQAQKIDTIDININKYKGVLVIREIKKNKFLSKNLSLFQSRIFQPFCHQLKATPYPRKMLWIDSIPYEPNNQGIIDVKLSNGWHTISIQNDLDKKFIPFKSVKLKFRKKRIYKVDIYLPTAFPAAFH